MLEGEVFILLRQLPVQLESAGLEDWQNQVFLKLLISTERNCRELLRSMDHDWLSETAWIARNLLELWIWTNFCAASRENSRRFYEDALREVKGLSETLQQLGGARGVQTPDTADMIRRVASDGQARFLGLGLLELHWNPLRLRGQ
jgi:hypothetical protein